MLATVDRDIVVMLGRGDTVLPDDYPRDVGWERLRWDGEHIVDLATMTGFWVEWNGAFVLHCKSFPGTVFLEMAYADKKLLVLNGGTPRLLTQQEIEEKSTQSIIDSARAELEKLLAKQESLYELIAFILGLLASALIYARTPNTTLRNQIGTAIDSILPELQALPITRMSKNASGKLTTIKTILENFFNKIDNAGG